jgi:guanylate kinase
MVSENYQSIIEKDSMIEWVKNFDKIIYTIESVIVNNIRITQCYELGSLITATLKSMEKFLM